MRFLDSSDISFIRTMVKEGGLMARDLQHTGINVHRKNDSSLVTEADYAVQNYIVSSLAERFPGIGFITEENYEKCTSIIEENALTAVIDPIDGTAMYTMGLPLWCVSVGIFSGYTPVYGFVYAPGADMFFYSDNDGSYLNNQPLHADRELNPDNETTIFYASEIKDLRLHDFPGKVRNLGSTAFHACLTVDNRKNRVLGFIGRSFLWDWAGAIPVIQGAGGRVIHLSGNPIDYHELINSECRFTEDLIATGIVDPAVITRYISRIGE